MNVHGQTIELWGTTVRGGDHNAGTIYKLDYFGSNHLIQKSFFCKEGAVPTSALVEGSNELLYGVASGGFYGDGVIFSYDPGSGTHEILARFNSVNGGGPSGRLVLASDGKFYGTTVLGGLYNKGVLFEFDPTTNQLIKIFDFDGINNGDRSFGSLIQVDNGKLYGLTSKGGSNNNGVLFEFDINSNSYSKLFDFDGVVSGGEPNGAVIQASNGKLYGMTYKGGTSNLGVLFEFDINTNSYLKKMDLDIVSTGAWPSGSLIEASNGKMYGMTIGGGANSGGVIFEYDPIGNSFVVLIDLDDVITGENPFGSLCTGSNGKLYGLTWFGGVNNDGVFFELDLITNNFEKIIDFDTLVTGRNPVGSVMQASNGKMYGMTKYGGSVDRGVLFEYNLINGNFVKKIDFSESVSGKWPSGSLLQANNGRIYGTTASGGIYGNGTLYEVNPATNFYSKKIDFKSDSLGRSPNGTLIQASNGKIYGLTNFGGDGYNGVIFEYDIIQNTCIDKYNFNDSLGSRPKGALVQGGNGYLYGMTKFGGMYGHGVLFEYAPITNEYTVKVNFEDSITGEYPYGSLTFGVNGKLYGMTPQGGMYGSGVIFEYDLATDSLVKLHDFNSIVDGGYPSGTLIEIDNGEFYGVTEGGGDYHKGVLFNYNLNLNNYTKLIDFDEANGSNPAGDLMHASNGKLYGGTSGGGIFDQGVIFEYNLTNSTYTVVKHLSNFDGMGVGDGHLIEVKYISQLNDPDEITIFPNPSNGMVYINTGIENIEKINVYSLSGELIYSKNNIQNSYYQFELEDIPGVYLIEIGTTKNISIKKLVIN